MFPTKVAEKLETHVSYPVTPFFENLAVYEKMCKCTVELDSPQMAV
jgi:hypothetical protein